MSTKTWIFICMTIGSLIGGYLPVVWGDNSLLSLTSIFTSTVGAVIGIFVGYKLGEQMGG